MTSPEAPLTCVIYVHTASHMQFGTREAARNGQLERCASLARAAAYSVVEIFVDLGLRGCPDRTALEKMIAAATLGAFEVVLVDDLNRLSRSPVELEAVLANLSSVGVQVRCCDPAQLSADCLVSAR